MGHLFRALALAQALKGRGGAVRIYANEDDSVARVLQERRIAWTAVPLCSESTQWQTARIKADGIRVWVDDRLETSIEHAREVLAAGARLVTFDDRGPGAALSDLHVVALPVADGQILAGRRVLHGLQFLVLDPAIRRTRRERTELRSTVVAMGGSDTYGLTVRAVRALRERGISATVVVGPGFKHEHELHGELDASFTLKRSVPSLPEEFLQHDLAITAGGITAFEANAAGLPCIVVAAEPWEERVGELLQERGGCRYAGSRLKADFSLLEERLPIEQMSRAALAAVPADGADRVAQELLAL